MAQILLVNGPNLNTLGEREPEIYGRTTLPQVEARVRQRVQGAGHQLACFQSNSEGALVDWLQAHRGADFLLLNAASLTHTSVALRDAVALAHIPFIEIHISNVHKREPFRHHSYLSDLAVGLVVGLGVTGYSLAADYAIAYLAGELG